MVSYPGSKLYQNKLFYGKTNFKIKQGSHISIELTRSRTKIKFDIDLIALSPDSRIEVTLAWRWMIAMMVSLVAIVIVMAISQFISDKVILSYTQYFIAVLVFLFFIFTSLFLVFSSRKRIFMTRHAKLPVIEFLISNPNKKLYNSFIDGLENEIIITAENRQLNQKQQRAGELKTLRRLSEQGIITKNEYKESKYTLLHA